MRTLADLVGYITLPWWIVHRGGAHDFLLVELTHDLEEDEIAGNHQAMDRPEMHHPHRWPLVQPRRSRRWRDSNSILHLGRHAPVIPGAKYRLNSPVDPL
jgi:hypothetical protein